MSFRNISRIPIVAGLIVVSALMVSALAGCSGNGNTNKEPVKEPEPTESTIYVMSANSRPTSSYEVEYKNDEHGNVTEYTLTKASPVGTVKRTTKQEFDENGWITASTMTQQGSSDKVEYSNELEKNDDGQVVKVTSTSRTGTAETTYEYHPNGAIKSRTTTQSGGSMDTEEFDENGYRIKQVTTAPNGEEMGAEFTWAFDESGNPTGWEATGIGEGALSFFGIPSKVELSLDEHGNITEMRDASTGKAFQRYSWERIDDPSEYAKLFSSLKR